MGLAAPKNRNRISADPQNTTWANNTTRFGHRILTSQGWTPGSSLGASSAAHAAHYTAASHSHIRVLLKDDNLGLGAKRGSERAENFGLAGLASILGRLNGNEEDAKKEEKRLEEVDRRRYVYQKFGGMNFVSGGFLVGGEIERKVMVKPEVKAEVKVEVKEEGEEPNIKDVPAADKKAKKRKRADAEEKTKDEPMTEHRTLKRKKKSMNLREEAAKMGEARAPSPRTTKEEEKESQTSKKSKHSSSEETATTNPTPTTTETPADRARRKAEKKARKEQKALKKALRHAAKHAAASPSESDSSPSSAALAALSSAVSTGSSTPASGAGTGTATGLTFSAGGRHAVRQKYIRSKRMAGMDAQALKEIFMIKTPSA